MSLWMFLSFVIPQIKVADLGDGYISNKKQCI